MLKKLAILFGIVFLAAGILGFVPAVTPHHHLFGIFHVNDVHNLIHILTGVIALIVGFTGREASKIFFEVFGIVYVIVGILGFVYKDQAIFGLIANNVADTWLHLIVGIVALYLGFVLKIKMIKKAKAKK